MNLVELLDKKESEQIIGYVHIYCGDDLIAGE
jgi:hypothetical protein